jgi:hypothetical protein
MHYVSAGNGLINLRQGYGLLFKTIQEPQGDTTLEKWWSNSRALVRRTNRKKFDTLAILTAWMLWK